MLQLLKKSLAHLSPRNRWVFLALTFLRILTQTLDIAGLATVGALASMIAARLGGSDTLEVFEFSLTLDADSFLVVITIVFFFFLAKSVISAWLLFLTTRRLASIEQQMSEQLASSVLDSGYSRFSKFSTSRIQWLLLGGSQSAFSNLLYSSASLVSESALFLFVLLGFLFVDPITTILLGFLIATVVFLYQKIAARRLHRIGVELAQGAQDLGASVLNITKIYREATLVGTIRGLVETAMSFRKSISRNTANQRFLFAAPRFVVEVAFMIIFLVLILMQYLSGSILQNLETTGLFIAGGMRLVAAILPLQNAISELRVLRPQATEVLNLLELDHELQSRPQRERDGCGARERNALGIELSNVSLSYGTSAPSLNELSLRIAPGSHVAIVGPSGAGKTSLALLALGLLSPTSGTVMVNGCDATLWAKSFPGSCAFVPQDPQLIEGSLAENITLEVGATKLDEEGLQKAIVRAGLADLVESLPEGLETSVFKNLNRLSGGQIQRVGIARALYRNPGFLVLDESTSQLDAETEASITRSVKSLGKSTTVLLIAHRMSSLREVDEILLLEDGIILERGSFKELSARSTLFNRYLDLQDVGGNRVEMPTKDEL